MARYEVVETEFMLHIPSGKPEPLFGIADMASGGFVAFSGYRENLEDIVSCMNMFERIAKAMEDFSKTLNDIGEEIGIALADRVSG